MIGKVSEFTEGKESFENYVERLEQFFAANDIKDEKKVAVFLSVVGPAAYGIVRNLVHPKLPKDLSYDEIVTFLKGHYNPKPLVISERFKFNKRNQKEGETVSEYVVELRRLATHCDFKTFLDDALRDRFVCGLRSETTQRKLLAEADLKFDGAIKLAVAMEMADKDTVAFGEAAPVHKVKISSKGKFSRANHATPGTSRQNQQFKKKDCYRCGGFHSAEECNHKKSKCYNCSKIGHLAKKCRAPKAANYVSEGNESSDSEEFALFVYSNSDGKSKSIQVNMNLNNQDVLFELDTGSGCTLINEHTFYEKFGDCNLKETRVKLKGYSGERINTLGEIMLTISGESKQVRAVVVKGDKPNLLGRDWLSVVKLDWTAIFHNVNFVQSSKSLQNLKSEYKEVFVKNNKPIEGFKATINMKENAQTWFHKARPVPYALKEQVTEELKKLESENIIKRVENSEWASPLVVVPKADKKSIRLCGDYKVSVNKEISEDQYPLPNIDDMFATLAGGQKFTKLDLTQAYAQLELDEKSKSLLTVNTHLGLFRYNRLAYGVSSAPAIFQSVMDTVLAGLPGVVCRIDDILITAANDEKHLLMLDEVFRRLQKHNIKLNSDKCEFMREKVVYMGHLVDSEGIHPTDDKTKAVLDAPEPGNVSELKSYLGLLNYYGAFLPNLSTLLHPLHRLLRKGVEWNWDTQCTEAFNKSKELLSSNKLLVHYDQKRELILACDASSYGVGAVISHVMDNGHEQPIAYASRTLTSAERNYAQIEKEALGIVFGVKRFHKYLYGQKFSLVTDHTALTTVFGPRQGVPTLAAARMQRWAIILSGYNYSIKYRKSAEHGNCDSLSRLPLKCPEGIEDSCDHLETVSFIEELPIESKTIAEATRKSQTLSKVLDFVKTGWPNYNEDSTMRPYFKRRFELSVDQGVLLWGLRVVVPEALRERMLREIHDQHLGINRMKSLARGYVWWPNLDAELEVAAANCETCNTEKSSTGGTSTPMGSYW